MNIKLLSPTASVPARASDGAAGYDLRADIGEKITLAPGEIFAVPTGVAIELPSKNLVAVLCARSGLAIKHGITLANGVGIIDSDYRGEIKVGIINLGKEPFDIMPGDRIAQLLIMPVELPKLYVTDAISETDRGVGGFGSTGRS
ncbi:MAG: dUTP diphosphatase [Oscillospiraceae bacterium]|nr:dUTP diphosphatase [Oscillospiraceae bacterium]